MQERLPLARPAHGIARLAMLPDLRHMPPHRFPAADLARVLVRHAPSHIVAAIPLEPTARVVGMNPVFASSDRKRLTGIDAEIVERAVAARG